MSDGKMADRPTEIHYQRRDLFGGVDAAENYSVRPSIAEYQRAAATSRARFPMLRPMYRAHPHPWCRFCRSSSFASAHVEVPNVSVPGRTPLPRLAHSPGARRFARARLVSSCEHTDRQAIFLTGLKSGARATRLKKRGGRSASGRGSTDGLGGNGQPDELPVLPALRIPMPPPSVARSIEQQCQKNFRARLRKEAIEVRLR